MVDASARGAPRPIDELVVPRWIIPIEPAGVVLEHHAIALDAGLIVAVVPLEEAQRAFEPARQTVLPEHVVTPGLVNLHTHAAMTLLRGVGDDLPLDRWLRERIWPIESEFMSHAFVLAGTRLACLEMMLGGVTTFNDMYFFPDAAGQAALECGMRASLGITVIDFPTAWGSDADDYLNRGLALRDALRDEPLVSFCLAPHAPYTVGDATFERIATLSNQLSIPIHTHLHETVREIEEGIAQTGVRPLARLERLGVVGPQLIAVHAVHLEPTEIELLAQCGASVAHCPSSNLKLASGIAPTAALLEAGINLGLGTDGAASNNRLDVLGEARLAALLAKGASGRADAFGVHRVLHALTLSGARALGLEHRIGSIEVGKEADLSAFYLGEMESQPCFDPASHLIFVSGRECVSDVWIRGKRVVEKRQFTERTAQVVRAEGATAVSLWQNRMELRFASLRRI